MNVHIRDNLLALKAPPTSSYVLNQGADYTTTSTSFVDLDATNLALTITTTGGDVLIGFYGYVYNATGSTFFDVLLDGVRVAGDDGLLRTSTAAFPFSCAYLKVSLAAGSHTFKLQWKVNTGTTTLYAGAGTASNDVHPQFWVREV
jgi:hypothetical protein